MKIRRMIVMVLIIALTLITLCDGAWSEYEPYDEITDNSEFKCSFRGGSSGAVSCNCASNSEIIIRRNMLSFSTIEIEITNCNSIIFQQNSIAAMRNLRNIRIGNVNSITFEEESISWYGYREVQNVQEEPFDFSIPSVKIHVYDSDIKLISSHSFRGRINEIIFERTVIENMSALSFSNLLQTENIIIKDSVLKNVALQSFKSFSLKNLELNNVTADLIPSRTFSNVIVFEKVLIDNCTFGTIHSGAFSISNPKVFQVTNNNISHLHGEAFKISSRGLVQINNNKFNQVDDGAFRAITTNRNEIIADALFSFESNTLSAITRNTLNVLDINSQFNNIYINNECDCSVGLEIQNSDYYTHVNCLHNGNYMLIKDFKSRMCSTNSNYFFIIIISSVTLILLFLIIIGLIVYYKLVYKTKKYGDKKQYKNGTLSLIVPDGRTYRETELQIIVEKNDVLTTDL